MKDTLADIREKLLAGLYKNEEQVRLSLVARILLELDWNVWDPREVYPEFFVASSEDKTKVDIALFANQVSPIVFIEIKPVGGIEGRLQETERQLRNYNRDNTALFSVITDGQEWRLYYSQTGGEFDKKLFKVINIKDDDLDVAATLLTTFLSKAQIETGEAKSEAEKYLQLNRKEKAMEDALPHARRMIQDPPYPTLPACLQGLVKQKGIHITIEEAVEYIKTADPKPPSKAAEIPTPPFSSDHPQILDPNNLSSVKFTKILEARFGQEPANGWKPLLEVAIRAALSHSVTLLELQTMLSTKLQSGEHNQEGFHPIHGTNVSMQGMNADNSLKNILILARRLRMPLRISLIWKKGQLSNKGGLLEWTP
jgi:hypothetical protein